MKLALGSVQFGLPYGIANQTGQVPQSEIMAMLHVAKASGIDILDTAIGYGESEACLGKADLREFRVVTKLPAIPDGCRNVNVWLGEQVSMSLNRLNVNAVYGLLLHRPLQLLEPYGDELFSALMALKEDGLVQKIGLSVYGPEELEVIIKSFRMDLVQAPLNLIDRRLCLTGWLQRLKDSDIEVHTRSVFLQGLLLMPQVAIPPKFSPWSDLFITWHQWLAGNGVSAIQACLAYPLSLPEIDRVVVGADSLVQLRQIIDAAAHFPQVELPDLYCNSENLINPSYWSQL